MSPRLKEKDTDPHGISASMKFVAKVADWMTWECSNESCANTSIMSALRRKAIRIRKKFRDKGERG